jgi:hypothetical protein
MDAMTSPADHAFSKGDVERLVRQLVPPIATETAKAVATETAKAIAIEVTRTLSSEVSRGVAEGMTTQFRILGIETSSAEAIARQHRRNQFTDDCIANRPKHDERMRALDEIARDYDPEDRVWVKEQRRRQERDVNTVRETFIRWIVPIVMGALLAAVGFRLIEGKTPAAPAVLPAAIEQRQVTGGEPTAGR